MIYLDKLPLQQYIDVNSIGITAKAASVMRAKQDVARISRYHRKKAGLSQQELAKLAGVGKTAVFDLEKGKESIQLDTLMKILKVLNIQVTFESPLMKEYEKEGYDGKS